MTDLTWRKVDDYHLRSTCGRFSISKVFQNGSTWYIAWRLTQREAESSTEIAATRLYPDATETERNQTVGSLKAVCEAAA